MPHATCAHCNVAITDHATMAERDGKTFCCNNCAATGQDGMMAQAALGTCAHCHVPIVDPSTRAEQNGETYCCSNCAAGMTAGASHQR